MNIKNKGIGRGSDIFKVPFELIYFDQTKNGRIDYGNIEELALSILENGQKQPIRATRKDDMFILRDGFRRYLAVRHIREVLKKDFPNMLVITTGRQYTEVDGFYEQIISNEALPFNMLEEGNVYTALVKEGEKQQAIAKKVGKSAMHISNCLALAALPKELKDFIIQDIVKPTLMLTLIKEYEDYDELVEVIKNREQEKFEKTDKKQTALPFDPNTGEIDTDKAYDLPKKECKLTKKDFKLDKATEIDDTNEEENYDNKGREISPVTAKSKGSGDDIRGEFVDNPIVKLTTINNMLISKNIVNEKVKFFTQVLEMLANDATPEEIVELFYE